ncbi:unnamed protein product [Ranitomeya imitator]|uniref:Uncharacterized protein n=1 Tax=Ranitomeya imitator TaxID=111125 RepID=A0ABN9L2U8_9NEOB|nr:unnamed protein product [Ranitomeya imitator]
MSLVHEDDEGIEDLFKTKQNSKSQFQKIIPGRKSLSKAKHSSVPNVQSRFLQMDI